MKKVDRYFGCLVGLAVGDALGAPYEFLKVTKPIKSMNMGQYHPIHGFSPVGTYTDDTSMALCLADSLLTCKGFSAHDQLVRYNMWLHNGYLSATGQGSGSGRTTREALKEFMITGITIANNQTSIRAGNGSIMRLAPIPMFYSNLETAIARAAQSSKTTHSQPACIEACRVLAEMVWKALHGYSKENILKISKSRIFSVQEISDLVRKNTYKNNPPFIEGSGYVVKSLEAAIWAFYKSRNFKHGALLAVNLGKDTDTTAAIYGQIAGAYYGYNAIPEDWRNKLINRDMIEDMARRLYEVSRNKIKT